MTSAAVAVGRRRRNSASAQLQGEGHAVDVARLRPKLALRLERGR